MCVCVHRQSVIYIFGSLFWRLNTEQTRHLFETPDELGMTAFCPMRLHA